jgi:hypothetical protein
MEFIQNYYTKCRLKTRFALRRPSVIPGGAVAHPDFALGPIARRITMDVGGNCGIKMVTAAMTGIFMARGACRSESIGD